MMSTRSSLSPSPWTAGPKLASSPSWSGRPQVASMFWKRYSQLNTADSWPDREWDGFRLANSSQGMLDFISHSFIVAFFFLTLLF